MAEDLELDGDDTSKSVPITRFKEVSQKNIENAKKAEEAEKGKAEAEQKTLAAEKKSGFYKDFSKLSSKYPGASEHLEEIETKVMAGYDPEDATVSVLNKAGKLNVHAERDTAAGGSSTTSPGTGKQKTIAEMSRDERRAALVEAEKRGDISMS